MYFQFIDCKYWLTSQNDVIYYKPSGMFGTSESLHAIQSLKKVVDSLPSSIQRFALIVDTSRFGGVTHDSFEHWRQAMNYWFEKGHAAMLRIDDSQHISYRVFLASFDEAYKTRMPTSLHQTLEDAWAQVSKLGFKPGELPPSFLENR